MTAPAEAAALLDAAWSMYASAAFWNPAAVNYRGLQDQFLDALNDALGEPVGTTIWLLLTTEPETSIRPEMFGRASFWPLVHRLNALHVDARRATRTAQHLASTPKGSTHV